MTDGAVGVLTFHRCINHGSYWQTRCLVDGLRAAGHDAVVLDHDSRRVNLAEWRCALRPTLPTPVPSADRKPYRNKVRKFHEAIATLPLSTRFDLDDPSPLGRLDAVVVGSDEVWNLEHPWYGGAPLFFGAGLSTARLVAYAASFGNFDASTELDAHWVDRLRDFASIAVRDSNSGDIVERALDRRPTVVLDPCLQFPLQLEGDWHGPDQPFVAVYGHNFSPHFAQEARRWADERGQRLVSISYRNDWADEQWLDAGPHDFAHAMARADSVVTNFFHGCVFALRNDRPFVCETTPYRSHKIRCLMADVEAEDHLFSETMSSDDFDRCLDEPIDAHVASTIETIRRRSTRYLDDALA